MAYSEVLAGRMRDALAKRNGIEERKIFGGLCFMLDGNMLCGVSGSGGDRFMFRVGKERQAEALERPGASAGPALIGLGLEPLQAHLFVFWFALLSTITPPVCGAVFIAAGMVGENWLKVAMSAMALGLGLYLIPLGMIANPHLIQFAASPGLALLAALKVGGALALVSFGVIAPKAVWLRSVLIVAGTAVLFA